MSYSVVPVQSRLVKDMWFHVLPLVRNTLKDDDRYQPEDILTSLLRRDMQLWLIEKDNHIHAVVITEITIYPRIKECTIVILAGQDVKAWMHLAMQVIGQWARSLGCVRGRMYGRPGWTRALKNIWTLTEVVMTYDITEGLNYGHQIGQHNTKH